MKREPTEEEITSFDRLVTRADELHSYAWCVKKQRPRYTAGLKGQECLRCEDFVMNGGGCDPI